MKKENRKTVMIERDTLRKLKIFCGIDRKMEDIADLSINEYIDNHRSEIK